MPLLVLATANSGKVQELRALLAQLLDLSQITLVTPSDLHLVAAVEESGQTFAENALIKARALAAMSGHVALADDSGLCVDALDGAPGLYSARWAGPNATDLTRTMLLLQKMEQVPPAQRTARFVCAAALAHPDGRTHVEEGVCEGVITTAPQGSDGFGYDPIFFLPAFGCTMAQLSPIQKNAISHRAQALKRLAIHFPHFLP